MGSTTSNDDEVATVIIDPYVPKQPSYNCNNVVMAPIAEKPKRKYVRKNPLEPRKKPGPKPKLTASKPHASSGQARPFRLSGDIAIPDSGYYRISNSDFWKIVEGCAKSKSNAEPWKKEELYVVQSTRKPVHVVGELRKKVAEHLKIPE